jgi:hypothetical protein
MDKPIPLPDGLKTMTYSEIDHYIFLLESIIQFYMQRKERRETSLKPMVL